MNESNKLIEEFKAKLQQEQAEDFTKIDYYQKQIAFCQDLINERTYVLNKLDELFHE